MGRNYYGRSFEVVEPAVVEKTCPDEYAALMAAFAETTLTPKEVAHMRQGLTDEPSDLDQQADLAEIDALIQAVTTKFEEKTQLRLGFEAAESDWELENGIVDLADGYYWEIFNVYILNPAATAFSTDTGHTIHTEYYVCYG